MLEALAPVVAAAARGGAQDREKEEAREAKLTELRARARAERAEFDRKLRELG